MEKKTNAQKYAEKKEEARAEAQEWQAQWFALVMSWEDCAEASAHFERLGRRYGLLREFRENGII